jgi:glucan phosphoethanolaminetransferase (alkaline phosphatase superfamily)
MGIGLLDDLWGNRRLILGAFVLAMPVLVPHLVWVSHQGSPEPVTAYLLLLVALAAAATVLCCLALASRRAYVLVCLPLAVAVMIQQHLHRHWGGGHLDARVEAYFESPRAETREYLESHLDLVDAAFLVAIVLYLVMLVRWAMRGPEAGARIRVLAASALLLGVAAVSSSTRLERMLRHFPPYAMAEEVSDARGRYGQLAGRNDYLRRHPMAAAECRSRYDKIVIVLGESAISDHMSIFGYAKPTTPFADRSRPHAFDALAPSNQTRYSLGMMLTRAVAGSFEEFFEMHSLVGELGRCGFHTLWISNQGRRGKFDSFSTSLANEAHEQIFLNDWSWHDVNFDEKVVLELEELGSFERRGQATFVHLIGSHTRYAERVPPGFSEEDGTDIVSQYDETIRYTDHVLSELHRRFQGGSVLFVYVSDHGQMVSEERFGSGSMPGYKEEFRTPLLIWTDDEESISSLRKAIGGGRLHLESFDDVMRYLIGLTPDLRVSTRDAVSILKADYVRNYSDLDSMADD